MMKIAIKYILILSMQLLIVGCMQSNAPKVSNSKKVEQKHYVYSIYSAENANNEINIESIENTFKENNIEILSSRNMNYPFMVRYGKLHFESYHLLMCREKDITYRLLTKYPKFALFLSMQIPIWKNNDKVYMALFTHEYMAKLSGIPQDDKDLLLYMQRLNGVIQSVLANAKSDMSTHLVLDMHSGNSSDIAYPITILETETADDYIADYEAEFEGELQKYGIKVPYYQDVLSDYSDKELINRYDFFHIYSLEKLNVLYNSSKDYPQSALNLPIKFYIYKKSGYDKIYIGYISPNSIIYSFDIKEKNVVEMLNNYNKMIEETIEYLKE